MASQKILFTVMPRGVTQNSDALPVSVYVSPRLFGSDRLKEFPDWLLWTPRLKDNGLSLTFHSGTGEITLPVNTEPLRSDLWLAMFNEETFVRSHQFDDYSGRAILSFPVRYALSTIKSIYQEAGVELALPDRSAPIRGEQDVSHHRQLIRKLLSGFSINWDEKRGATLRDYYRDHFGSPTAAFFPTQYQAADLGPDGLLKTMPPPAADEFFRKRMTEQFAVFNHVPPGKPIDENPPDFATLIDFHQALSALNSYPALMRALGLVLDFDLPVDFLRPPAGFVGKVGVSDVPNAGWQLADTQVPPGLPLLETAYVLVATAAQNDILFATAPGALGQLSDQIETLGLLNMMPGRYGLAQVDVDGALHKAIMLSETWQDGKPHPAVSDHPEVFDNSATLPSLRSGGVSLFADGRALKLLAKFKQSKVFNDALTANAPMKRPFYAEDLIHGYRLDVWDSNSNDWHSLHMRDAVYRIGEEEFKTEREEGFSQLAATEAAPDPDHPSPDDLYLHEAVARWAGWSLSVPMPGKHLSSNADPDKALDNPNENEPATPFKMTTEFHAAKGSLPGLRFGRRYRIRARVVDICGNSIAADDPFANLLANAGFSIPADVAGFPYLRYESVAAPIVVVRDTRAITDPGSSIDRLVIRTFNSELSLDAAPADLAASDRHLVPPRTSVDTAEKLSMFDEPGGKLVNSAAMYDLIAARDKGELNQTEITVAGHLQKFPLEPEAQIDPLPYLPDVLAHGIALRDLPGTGSGTLGLVAPGGALEFQELRDPNPRPGSATLIGFGGSEDWQRMLPVRLALGETTASHDLPDWDDAERVLTVYLPKGTQSVVPLSSYMTPDDLKLMGVWQWIREHIDVISTQQPDGGFLRAGDDVDKIAHVLQRSVEGGHWMLNPPRLLTLVHALQQPIGTPSFCAISVQHQPYGDATQYPYDETRDPSSAVLQTTPEKSPTAETELASITAWRRPGSVDSYLMGGLRIHGASTEKVDILAEWTDPIDDVSKPRVAADPNSEAHAAHVDEVPIRLLKDGIIGVKGGTPNARNVAYFDRDHDLLCFVRANDSLGNLLSPDTSASKNISSDAAPRHHLNDTKHHRISYKAVATSRFREYFAPDQDGGFTRTSQSILVDVPASTRPNAPQIAYVVPTFGWQRQTETNLKRSVRFGGGLRVYMERPWFSSGAGELLGVSLYNFMNGVTVDHESWKGFATRWGGDPIWRTDPLSLSVPQLSNFPGNVAREEGVSLEVPAPGRVNVVGYPVAFDEASQLWYADLTINTETLTYAPFIRLALARYQPHAIPDAKMSRVVLADFAQLTPTRAAIVTVDPYHPRRLRVTVSGIAPTGPAPVIHGAQPAHPATQPTVVSVTVQQRMANVSGDLGWEDATAATATVKPQSTATPLPNLIRWSGTVEFLQAVEAGRYRLLIREHEYLSANYLALNQPGSAATPHPSNPGRLIYTEVMEIDTALIGAPAAPTGTMVDE